MPNSFALNKRMQEGISIIELDGYLDAHTAPQFEQAMESEIEHGNDKIVVDCARLTYISSAGLGVFMSFVEEVREQGGDIKICSLDSRTRQVFDILGFPDIYDILADIPAALRCFSQSPARKD